MLCWEMLLAGGSFYLHPHHPPCVMCPRSTTLTSHDLNFQPLSEGLMIYQLISQLWAYTPGNDLLDAANDLD